MKHKYQEVFAQLLYWDCIPDERKNNFFSLLKIYCRFSAAEIEQIKARAKEIEFLEDKASEKP